MSDTNPPETGSPYAYWGSSYWDSGKRWAPGPGPIERKNNMSIITILVSKLTVPQKLQRIGNIIELSTNNANVPGNATLVAEVQTAWEAFQAAQNAMDTHRLLAEQLLTARNDAEAACLAKLAALAGFTESATGGDAAKILTTGFGVKGAPTPPQPVGQVLNVKVAFTGEPGKSLVTWKADPHAVAYVVECTLDPDAADGWKYMATVKRPKFIGNGATPGQPCWYRIRAINDLGEGPWSEPALRPVY